MRGGQDHDLLGIAMQQTAAATDAGEILRLDDPPHGGDVRVRVVHVRLTEGDRAGT